MADNQEDYRDLVYLFWAKLYEPLLFLLLCLVAQSDLTPCDPMDCSSPGFSGHGTSQAGILEWVAISSSRGSYRSRNWTVSPALEVDSLPPWKLMNHYYSFQMELWKYCPFFFLLHVFRLFFHLSFKYLVSISLTPPCHLSLCTLAEPIFLLLWPPSLTDSSSSSGSTCAWLALSPLLQVTYPSSGLPWGLWWLSLSIVSQFCGC